MDARYDSSKDPLAEPEEVKVDHRSPTAKDIRIMPWTLAACEALAERVVAARLGRKADRG